MVDDGERIAVAVVAEKELTFVVDGHQIVRFGGSPPCAERMLRRVTPASRSDEVGPAQDVADGGRSWPVDEGMKLAQANGDLARPHVRKAAAEGDDLCGDLIACSMRNV